MKTILLIFVAFALSSCSQDYMDHERCGDTCLMDCPGTICSRTVNAICEEKCVFELEDMRKSRGN